MKQFYVMLGDNHYDDNTSWTDWHGAVVVYAKSEADAHDLAERLYPEFTVGWPTIEAP